MSLYNDTKHDRVCKSVSEINDHAKNFPNAPRMFVTFYLLVELRHIYSICKLYKLLENCVPLFNRVHPKSLIKTPLSFQKYNSCV